VSLSRDHAYWVFPVAFVVHDFEELLTMPAWFRAHQHELRTFLTHLGVGPFIDSFPTTFARAALAIAPFLILVCAVTAGVSLRWQSGVWRALYGGLLGAFLLHTFTHVAWAVIFRAYTPGLITAVLVVAPVSLFLCTFLLRRGAIDLKPSLVAALVALALLLPCVLSAFRLSRWLFG